MLDIYRLFDPTVAECKLFLSVHKIFTKKDHILERKISLKELKNIQIIQIFFTEWIQFRYL